MLLLDVFNSLWNQKRVYLNTVSAVTAADTPAVRFGQETRKDYTEFALNEWEPKGIPSKCAENGNKDFTIDLTSKKVITPLFSH